MRQGLTALFIALIPCWIASSAMAEGTPSSVIAIDDALFSKNTELEKAQDARDKQKQQLDLQQEQLDKLSQEAHEYDSDLAKAKQSLAQDYQRMIDDPDIDISQSQDAYQKAWSSVKQNQKSRLEAEQKAQETKFTFDQAQANVKKVEDNIASLLEDKKRARVERLKSELSQTKQEKVSFTNLCQSNMTIAQCTAQTQELALQKAVKQFQKNLVAQTSESTLVERNINSVSLNIHVLRHKTLNSGFYDGMRFRSVMQVELNARPSESASCKLLGLESKYCFAPGTYADKPNNQQEIAWVSLSIRSNQYNDQVFVDGVSYGSTPVEIMVPVGNHMITVQKEGFRSFHRELKIRSDHNLRAVLREKENKLVAGKEFADALTGKTKAPDVVTILSGEYLVGENASKQVNLDHAYAIGATPVTVTQFENFINRTSYQTDAELKNTCTTVEGSEVTPIAKSYWRDPGFKQYPNSPVVCVSRNDANAYARWLSNETGYKYRLPSEDEWEIAALAGSHDNYWWGNKFEPGKANTGWGGTPWSNKSTSPVSAFASNPLGLYDMVGNVWQWTTDKRGLAKGGAWNFSPAMAEAYQRLFIAPSGAANYVGFRVVREIN